MPSHTVNEIRKKLEAGDQNVIDSIRARIKGNVLKEQRFEQLLGMLSAKQPPKKEPLENILVSAGRKGTKSKATETFSLEKLEQSALAEAQEAEGITKLFQVMAHQIRQNPFLKSLLLGPSAVLTPEVSSSPLTTAGIFGIPSLNISPSTEEGQKIAGSISGAIKAVKRTAFGRTPEQRVLDFLTKTQPSLGEFPQPERRQERRRIAEEVLSGVPIQTAFGTYVYQNGKLTKVK